MTGPRSLWLLGSAGLVVAAVPTVVAATSTTADEPWAGLLVAFGVLLVWTVAMAMWTRPRDRRLAELLFLLALAYAIRGLAASDNPWVFSTARALGQVAEFVLVWVMLAFPSGLLRSRADRIIVALGGFAAIGLWIPTVMLSVAVPLAGPLVPCDGDCPTNALLVADQPMVAALFADAFRVVSMGALIATATSLLVRLIRASALTRRMLAPVLITSALRTLAIAVFVFSRGSQLSGLVLVFLFWAIPLSMALGLLLGRLHTAAGLQRLVAGLQVGPDKDQLRNLMAQVLDDPDLKISYWLPDRRRWAQPDGHVTADAPTPGPGQVVTITSDQTSEPVAALIHDEVLLEEPALMEAVTSSTRLALETNQVRSELALSDARVADAHSRAREELERDLHDGAQNRLIALRMKVSVLRRLFDQDVSRAASLAAELGPDIDATLREVRDLAHGRGSRRIEALGLTAALQDLASAAPVEVSVDVIDLTSYPSTVENAIYFTCAEALQNAAKHAGSGVHVKVRATDDGCAVRLVVSDDGPGASATSVGFGLEGIRRRVASAGGEVEFASEPGNGFRLNCTIPHD